MEKIIMTRGYGKTYQLIKKSAETGHYIVCHQKSEVLRIQREAQKLNLIIPSPITYEDFTNKNCLGLGIPGVLIDNVDKFLQNLSVTPITAITMCP